MREHLLDGITIKWPRGDVIPARLKKRVFLRIELPSFFHVFLGAKCFKGDKSEHST